MRISKLLMPAVTVAGALALAGCGGGSSTPAGDPPPECPAGTTGTPPDDCKPTGGEPQGDPATVLELADDLAKATEALEDNTALKTAQDADGKLRASDDSASYAASLQGRSASAQAYAQMVLDAKTGLESELKTAREALEDAEKRLETASDVEKRALQRVIKDAKEAIEKAEETLKKGGDLDDLVMAYTNKGSVKTNAPADRASAYARALLNSDGRVRGTRAVTALDGTANNALGGDDVFGDGTSRTVMSLSDIFGSDRNDAGNVIAALAGVDLSKVTVTGNALSATNAGQNGSAPTGSYQGIGGVFHCYQVNCKAVDDGTIGAGWFFVPTPSEGTFHYAKDGDTYERVAYVEWGLWMTGTTEPILNAYVGPGRGSTDLPAVAGTGDLDDALNDDNKATYSGTATGLSVRETGSGDSAVSHSGHFTADMKLNASFGDTPTLVGTVRNFQPVSGQGTAHVNTGWALDLEGTGFTGGGFKENGPTGTWTAQAYGGSVTDGEQARPTGVYGTVNAAFSDGAAAGVYHTAKD